jgi:uncharacterized protein
MTAPQESTIGTIVWRDLTVANAQAVCDFYQEIVGWKSTPHSMGDYDDYEIHPPAGKDAVAGICHARGANEKIPPQWLMYVRVVDVDVSARRCVELGGRVVDGPRDMGKMRFCVIQDPAGAIMAIVS